MSTELRAAGLTDVGRARERNEDAYFVGRSVFAVADGLGGHKAGEVASRLALSPIEAADESGSRRAAHHIAEAVRRSNRAVHERAQGDPDVKGMATTLTAVAIHDGIAHLAHVGDSRCYLLRGGAITQLSRDHTLVARMVADGKLTPAEAEQHPQRSVLTRALGHEREVDVQTQNVVLSSGDRLLLCSDGLSGILSDDELLRLSNSGSDLDEICRALIEEANARGGPDNITAIVVDVTASPREGTAEPVPDSAAGARPAARRVPIRALVWTGIVAVLLLGGILGLRGWAGSSYYVGVDEDERVTIYRGLPITLPLVPRTVEEATDVHIEDIGSPSLQRSLEDGIRAGSLEEARRIVDEQVRPNASGRRPKVPTPEPTPSP